MRAWTLPVAIALYLLAGLFPFDWYQPLPRNAAEHTPDGALRFNGPGIASTSTAPGWLASAISSRELTVRMKVRSTDRSQTGPARLLTISPTPYERNFTLGQEHDDLVVRLRTPGKTFGRLEWIVRDVFTQSVWRDIEVGVRDASLAVHVDGELRLSASLPPNVLESFDRTYPLALGNEMTGDRPWRGEIARAEVTTPAQHVDYMRSGELSTPARFPRFTHAPQLVPFVTLKPDDAVLNLLGFIPLGILAALWRLERRPRVIVSATLLVAAVSLLMELAQLFIRSRYTSINDLLLNSLGGFMGVLVAHRFAQYVPRAIRDRP